MSRFGLPLASALLAITLTLPTVAAAAESDDALARLRQAVTQTRKALEEMREKLDRAEGFGSSSQGGVSASVFGGGIAGPAPSMDDFRRGAREVNSGAQLISSATSKCGKHAKAIARRFNADARRVQGAVSRLASRGETGMMQMRFALDSAQDTLGDVNSISSCNADDTTESDDEAEEEKEISAP